MSTTRPEGQRGFSLVAAIFILVVFAALGGFIVSVSGTQHMSQALDLMNSRARQAAQAGVEWGVYQVAKLPAGTFAANCNGGTGYTGAASASQALTGLDGLSDFRVEIECHSNSYQEGADPAYRVYQITVTACNAGGCPAAAPGLGYVEHRQVARVKQ